MIKIAKGANPTNRITRIVIYGKRKELEMMHRDLVDDLEMSWQQALEQADLPLLKRFWENGVAGYQL